MPTWTSTPNFHSRFWSAGRPLDGFFVKRYNIIVNTESKCVLYSKSSLLTVDGKALTEARIKANLPLGAVAAKLGCNKGTISRWEQGRLCPSLERMFGLVEIYGTNNFLRLNSEAIISEETVAAVKRIFGREDVVIVEGLDRSKYIKKEDIRKFHEVVGDRDYFDVRLNGKIDLTAETIAAVKKLMEG